jgi:AcrR family transcriptional regulator
MGRRSSHTSDELRHLILGAAEDLIAEGGLSNLSAREIAKRIGYSPGTIYNVFENLDDVILHVEARLLDALDERLDAIPESNDPKEYVRNLAMAYLRFTHEHPRRWNLLFEHHLPPGTPMPAWYQDKLDLLMSRVEHALKPIVPDGDAAALQRAARVLWAGVHGITSLSTADKLSSVTAESALPLIEDLVAVFLSGLAAQQQRPSVRECGPA